MNNSESKNIELPKDTQKMLSTDGMILGLLLGGALLYWAGIAFLNGEHLIHSPVVETFWVAFFLTMVVAYCGLKMPVFMSHSPKKSTFFLVMFCGHISLFFDSFAVVLLLSVGITFLPLSEGAVVNQYNVFVVKATSAFSALTVGGAFYLGELWGLPYYLTNNMGNPLAGLPLLLVLTPYCAVLAFWAAVCHTVKLKEVVMDKKQVLAAFEFTVALLLIIITHSPFLCIGVLLMYTALRGYTVKLVEKTAHELKDGALLALGLILLAVIYQHMGDTVPDIRPWLQGTGLFLGAAVSSPFAGAMAPPATDLGGFYKGLSLLMLGAPLFVFSSLVAIVVFRNTLKYNDLPDYVKPIVRCLGGKRVGHIQEGVAYTILMIPMISGLALLLYVGNHSGLFVWAAKLIGLEMSV